MTPETGARISMMPLGWSISAPNTCRCSAVVSTVTFASLIRVLCHFQIFLSDRALFLQILGAFQLRLRRASHPPPPAGNRRSAGDVRALHPHQQLPFGDRIAQPRVDFDDAARSQRNHRNLPRDIGGSPYRWCSAPARHRWTCRHHRKLVGMIHFRPGSPWARNHLRGRGSFGGRVRRGFLRRNRACTQAPAAVRSSAAVMSRCLIESPRCPRPGSTARPRSDTNPPGSDNSIQCPGNSFCASRKSSSVAAPR